MVILFMYHTQKNIHPTNFPSFPCTNQQFSTQKKGNLHIKRRVSFFPRASFCTFVPLRSENLLSSVKNSTQETCMSHVFLYLCSVKGEASDARFYRGKTTERVPPWWVLCNSYAALMLLLCSSYSWRELEGYHYCLPKQERETPGKSTSAFMKTKESQQ